MIRRPHAPHSTTTMGVKEEPIPRMEATITSIKPMKKYTVFTMNIRCTP